jgi:excisionase family DNA binding protein
MLYTVKQVAIRWGVSAHTVYNMIERRTLSCVRFGRTVRLRHLDIEEFEARNVQPVSDAPEDRVAAELDRIRDEQMIRELARKMRR